MPEELAEFNIHGAIKMSKDYPLIFSVVLILLLLLALLFSLSTLVLLLLSSSLLFSLPLLLESIGLESADALVSLLRLVVY